MRWAGLDLLQADVDGLRVDGGVLLRLRMLGAVKLRVERLDLVEGGRSASRYSS